MTAWVRLKFNHQRKASGNVFRGALTAPFSTRTRFPSLSARVLPPLCANNFRMKSRCLAWNQRQRCSSGGLHFKTRRRPRARCRRLCKRSGAMIPFDATEKRLRSWGVASYHIEWSPGSIQKTPRRRTAQLLLSGRFNYGPQMDEDPADSCVLPA